MQLVNRITTGQGIKLATALSSRIEVFSTKELSEDIITSLMFSTLYITQHHEFDNIRNRMVSLIFTDSSEISFQLSDENGDYMGLNANLILYKLPHIEGKSQTEQMIIITEELVHHFWDLSDELRTKSIVCDIIPNVVLNRENLTYIII